MDNKRTTVVLNRKKMDAANTSNVISSVNSESSSSTSTVTVNKKELSSSTSVITSVGVDVVTSSPTSRSTSDAIRGPTSCDKLETFPLSTPKKSTLDPAMLQSIHQKLSTPGKTCELQSLHLDHEGDLTNVNFIKDRYLIYTQPAKETVPANSNTPTYRHLIDLTTNLKCTDVFSGEQYLCKIINEPLDKVQKAYFALQHQKNQQCHSYLYGHQLIRPIKDISPLNNQRTYVILSSKLVYEDLHTYIRNKRRLCEKEARALFYQICETVRICHHNGIILRDLKLKRFYFVNKARTMLQYESLEGSMILYNLNDDTLSDKIGCPMYTAPELLCPNPTYQGKPADIWSLGVILYTMLVGQYPFYEKGNCNLITIIRHTQVQIPSYFTHSLRKLLLGLLCKDFVKRMPVDYIFLSPWLKEQRPFYMYIRVGEDFVDEDTSTTDLDDNCGVRLLDHSSKALNTNCELFAEMG
uniref:Protein kinase domain-containing protein n=1 Tax=Glossina morsitans morsitans TaxID=37546 RepID=A0A1B0FBL7_GLOMM